MHHQPTQWTCRIVSIRKTMPTFWFKKLKAFCLHLCLQIIKLKVGSFVWNKKNYFFFNFQLYSLRFAIFRKNLWVFLVFFLPWATLSPKNVKLQARSHEYVQFLENQQHSCSRSTRRLPQACKYQTGSQVWATKQRISSRFLSCETIHYIQSKKLQIFVAPKLEATNRSKKQVRLKGPHSTSKSFTSSASFYQ